MRLLGYVAVFALGYVIGGVVTFERLYRSSRPYTAPR